MRFYKKVRGYRLLGKVEACPMINRFFKAGFSSGTRLRRPASG
jgi:hypothetical protein